MPKKSKKPDKANLSPTQQLSYHISEGEGSSKLATAVYEQELGRLQVELVKMQYWVKHTGTRIVILFEGPMQQGKAGRSNALPNRSIPVAVEL